KDGVYTFRAQGGIYHLIGSLLPIDGIPKFLQLYIYDTEFETANRLYIMPQLRQDILEFIKLMLNQLNPFIINFRSISSYMNIAELCLLIRADHGLDQRVYNKPTASQVAAVWVEGNNSIEYAERDIIVQSQSKDLIRISELSGSYDPMQYPLLFPQGDYGWHPNILQYESQKKNGIPDGQLRINAVLLHIKHLLEQHHKCLNDFDLPTLILPYDLPNELPRLILNELNIPVSAEDLEKIRLLNEEQKLIFDTVMEIKIFRLHRNMRTENNPEATNFNNFLMRIGNGTEETINDNMIRVPNNMIINWNDENSLQTLIEEIYPSLSVRSLNASYFTDKAILTTKNEYVDDINSKMLNQLPGEIITYR
ncbi:3887_t:CDS:2, partial [Racocetra fulgida]